MISRIGNVLIYISYETQKNSSQEWNVCVRRYCFNTYLSCCLLFSSFVMWGSKLLNNFIAEYVTPFWMEEKQVVDLCRWFFCLVFTECTDRLVINLTCLLTTKLIKDNIFKQGIGSMLNCLNLVLHEHL